MYRECSVEVLGVQLDATQFASILSSVFLSSCISVEVPVAVLVPGASYYKYVVYEHIQDFHTYEEVPEL